ncbi:MAG: type II secretion system GspH family protein [Patescibacteria group bacterium]|nr:type II secretion system GspH family protein [Patescibacteria group bacterium]
MKRSFSLIELMVALGVFVLVASAIIFLVIGSQQWQKVSQERAVAIQLAQEAMEAVRSIRDRDWNELKTDSRCSEQNLRTRTYGLKIVNNAWTLSTLEIDKKVTLNNKEYTRLIKVDCVFENGIANPDKKKITVEVSWGVLPGRSISLVSYLTNWRSADFATKTKGDFEAGVFENTKLIDGNNPIIKLDDLAGATIRANEFFIDGFTNTSEITTNKKISFRFTAQNNKTPNQVKFYINQVSQPGTFRAGLQNNANGQPSGTWLCSNIFSVQQNFIGWQTVNLSGCPAIGPNTDYKIVHLVIEPQ